MGFQGSADNELKTIAMGRAISLWIEEDPANFF